MIGSALKKLAQQNGMIVSGGVAYGSLRGYATTLSQDYGFMLVVSTTFPELAQKDAFYAAVNAVDLSRAYGVQKLDFTNRMISVFFADGWGAVKKMESFINWFYPLLAQHGATGAHVCAECGSDASAGGWYMVGGTVHRLHDSCAERLKTTIETDQQTAREQDDGSYVQGFFGALAGSLIGAVAWAVVYALGYVASIVGLLMGWLADKGYGLLHGKQGKGRVAILIFTVILAVFIGVFAGIVISLQTEGYFESIMDTTVFTLEIILTEPEMTGAFMSDVLVGLLFAGLGVFGVLRKAANEVADVKFKKMG